MTTSIKLPIFKGKPLIEIPENIPTIGFMEGDFGEAVLEEYKERTEKDYNGVDALDVLSYDNGIEKAKALGVISYDDGIVKGSNLFAVVLVNQIVSQEKLRAARQSDLEKALKIDSLNLRGTYEDTGLVLRSERDNDRECNSYLAKDLSKQLGKTKFPVMIPLTSLELRNDNDSPYGLSFNLTGDFVYAPIFNENGHFASEDVDNETGLPSKLSNGGSRSLYTRDSGLSRLYLYRYLDLDSYNEYLAYSDDDGRVVVVSEGEAATEN